MKIIGITGGKGGTGKSTIATALAYELAKNSDLQIIAVEPDAAKVAQARAALSKAALYGSRVTVHTGTVEQKSTRRWRDGESGPLRSSLARMRYYYCRRRHGNDVDRFPRNPFFLRCSF